MMNIITNILLIIDNRTFSLNEYLKFILIEMINDKQYKNNLLKDILFAKMYIGEGNFIK